MPHKTWRAKRSLLIDLDYDTSYPIAEGQTYTDDGTTIFHEYICDELFDAANPAAGTVMVSHPDARRSKKN